MIKKIRQEFASTMLEVGKKDKNLVVMVGDISHGILKPFAKICKGRYFNIGICEPTTVNMAAGLNKLGFNPVVHTIAPFLIERCYEQIKLDFAYQKLSVNLVSVGGSYDYSKLGCSHHCYTDVSLLSHFKSSSIVIPASTLEFNILFKKIYKKKGIKYFRIPEKSHNYKLKKKEIIFGKSILIEKGNNVTICVTGHHLDVAIEASKFLKKKNINCEIIYFHTLKPFDPIKLIKSVKKTKKIITIEELSSHDGLHNLCIKSLVGINNIKTKQIAVEDFVHDYGTIDELNYKTGLNTKNIVKQILKLI